MTTPDAEAQAIWKIVDLMVGLSRYQARRVITYLESRYGFNVDDEFNQMMSGLQELCREYGPLPKIQEKAAIISTMENAAARMIAEAEKMKKPIPDEAKEMTALVQKFRRGEVTAP